MTDTVQDWFLSEREGLREGPALIRRTLAIQRSRVTETLRNLSPAEWSLDSRCEGWSVHDVARHLVDVAEFHRDALAGKQGRLTKYGPFDLPTTPSLWLTDSADQTPAQTVRLLSEVVRDEGRWLASRVAVGGDALQYGPLGRPLHWSLMSMHVFWESWIHERDINVPLGIRVEPSPAELRLAVLYGLLIAAQPCAMRGDPLEASFDLVGSPDGLYCVGGTSTDITITPGPGSTPFARGEMYRVLDGLTGRGAAFDDLFTPAAIEVSGKIADGLKNLRTSARSAAGPRAWFQGIAGLQS
ncbi:maleylpyruvate isomerase family mycothiol-dependent enzyme [Streptomyces sp. NPDC054775]